MKRFGVICAIAAAVLWSAPARASEQVDTIEVATTLIPGPMKCAVVVPERYSAPGDTARYPVVYMLNGHGGDYRSWPSLLPKADSLATLYDVIIVCPDGRNSWYWDSPVDPSMQMESFFTDCLIPTVDSLYRTMPARGGRAITGLSMGGHGALWLAWRHPDLFGAAGSMSGGVDIRPFPANWNMADRLGPYEENPERWNSHTVMELVPEVKPGEVAVIFDCGYDDFFFEVNNKLHAALLERRVPHDYTVRPGGHTGDYWANSILYHLQFFNRTFNDTRVNGGK